MPECFEFTEELLIFVADHCHSGLFGTFFGNSDRQVHSLVLGTYHAAHFRLCNIPRTCHCCIFFNLLSDDLLRYACRDGPHRYGRIFSRMPRRSTTGVTGGMITARCGRASHRSAFDFGNATFSGIFAIAGVMFLEYSTRGITSTDECAVFMFAGGTLRCIQLHQRCSTPPPRASG